MQCDQNLDRLYTASYFIQHTLIEFLETPSYDVGNFIERDD